MTTYPKWGVTGEKWSVTEPERVFYVWLSRVMMFFAVVLVIWSVATSSEAWHTMAGCMVMGFSAGRWLVPYIKALDLDRFPQGKDFEDATASMSDIVAWASLGSRGSSS